ncbi:MAG TPA: hypothetical protein PKH50_02810 [bacterium]|nr:hypothetical protein [bacterium]
MSALINGLVLSLINIISIILGFIIYQISKSRTQISIQIISACFFSVVLFLLWQFISQKLFRKITIEKKSDYWKTYSASILFSPVIFIPLHYLTEGYLTSWQNIAGIFMFQIPTNILILKIYQTFAQVLNIKRE